MFEIGFEWSRGLRYELARDKKAIIQVGKNERQVLRPLEMAAKVPLYLRFSRLAYSPEACLDFARLWGFLVTPAGAGAAESIDGWKREIQKMRGLITVFGDNPGQAMHAMGAHRMEGLADLAVTIERRAPGERPALVMRPKTLLNAMRLQLARFVTGDGSLRICKQCGDWFEAGEDGRRSVSVFCSQSCKNRFHYRKRASQ